LTDGSRRGTGVNWTPAGLKMDTRAGAVSTTHADN